MDEIKLKPDERKQEGVDNQSSVNEPTYNSVHRLQEVQNPKFMETPIDSFSRGMNRKRIIAVSSSGKGGTGKSTTSLMLALFYQELNKNTALIDLDIPMGDIATMLGMSNERCISDFVGLPKDLSDKKIRENMLLTYYNGLKVLPALRDLRDQSKVNRKSFIDDLLLNLKSFDTIIMDLGPNFEPLTVRALEMATEIVLVTDDYETTFQNIYQGKQVLQQIGIDVNKIKLVINKSTSKNEKIEDVRATNVEKITSIGSIYFFPMVIEMPKLVDKANYIVLDNKKHRYKQAVHRLIEDLSPELFTEKNKEEQKNNHQGFFSKLFGGKK